MSANSRPISYVSRPIESTIEIYEPLEIENVILKANDFKHVRWTFSIYKIRTTSFKD